MIFTNPFSRSSAKKQEEMKKAQEEMEALNKIASDNRAMAKKFEDMIKL